MSRRLLLEIEYDGTNTLGFQTQKSRTSNETPAAKKVGPKSCLPSVQGTLEETLSRFFAQTVLVDGAGRTDAGVHATGQVVAFTVEGPGATRKIEQIVRGLNCILPQWIRVRRAAEAPVDFRPRYRATRRRYHYHILDGQTCISHPFWSRYCHVETCSLDVDSMNRAAQLLLGHRDFRPYSKSEPTEKNTWRVLHSFEVIRSAPTRSLGIFAPLQELITVDICANAFLRSMVRMLVGGLLKIGRGEWAQQRLLDRLLDGDVHRHRLAAAPSQGLTLVEVHLPDISWT